MEVYRKLELFLGELKGVGWPEMMVQKKKKNPLWQPLIYKNKLNSEIKLSTKNQGRHRYTKPGFYYCVIFVIFS